MPPLVKGNSCQTPVTSHRSTMKRAAQKPPHRCSCIAPSLPSGAARTSSCFQRPAWSVLPPSAASRRCCVAVAPPERSPRVLAVPFTLLPHPLPIGARVPPLVPRDRPGRIGVVPVAYAPAARHRSPPCAAAAQSHLAPTLFLRAPVGVAARRMPRCCDMPVASSSSTTNAGAPAWSRRFDRPSLSSFTSVYFRCVASAPLDFPAPSWRWCPLPPTSTLPFAVSLSHTRRPRSTHTRRRAAK